MIAHWFELLAVHPQRPADGHRQVQAGYPKAQADYYLARGFRVWIRRVMVERLA